MSGGADATASALARFAAALAEPTRAAMCLALLDGRAWTATELARLAGVAPSTASEHLDRLVEAGVLAQERQGRHRYLRLAGPEVAALVEDLTAFLSPGTPAPDAAGAAPGSLRGVRSGRRFAAARTCYDHLAGTLGVGLLDAFVARDLVSTRDGLALTAAGRAWFVALVGEEPFAHARGRPLVRACLDRTERRHHLGGALGAALCRELLDRGWLLRAPTDRAVVVTPAGRLGLGELVGPVLPEARPVRG
jgi:DNA-binding transcriptional ArsR family regulator